MVRLLSVPLGAIVALGCGCRVRRHFPLSNEEEIEVIVLSRCSGHGYLGSTTYIWKNSQVTYDPLTNALEDTFGAR